MLYSEPKLWQRSSSHQVTAMICPWVRRLEVEVRRVWCIGGQQMTIDEVAFQVGHTAASLRTALSHIPNLSYYTIRNAGLEILFAANSDQGRTLGFLSDGDAFEILARDSQERWRMTAQRDALCLSIMKTSK